MLMHNNSNAQHESVLLFMQKASWVRDEALKAGRDIRKTNSCLSSSIRRSRDK